MEKVPVCLESHGEVLWQHVIWTEEETGRKKRLKTHISTTSSVQKYFFYKKTNKNKSSTHRFIPYFKISLSHIPTCLRILIAFK